MSNKIWVLTYTIGTNEGAQIAPPHLRHQRAGD